MACLDHAEIGKLIDSEGFSLFPRERQKITHFLRAAGNAIRPPVTPLVTSSPERADLGDRTHPAANQSTKRVSWSTGLPIAAER
jgi:hypothetical protein